MADIIEIVKKYNDFLNKVVKLDVTKFISDIRSRIEGNITFHDKEIVKINEYMKLIDYEIKLAEFMRTNLEDEVQIDFNNSKLNFLHAEKRRKENEMENIISKQKFIGDQIRDFDSIEKDFIAKHKRAIEKLVAEKPLIDEIEGKLSQIYNCKFSLNEKDFAIISNTIIIQEFNNKIMREFLTLKMEVERLFYGDIEEIKNLYQYVDKEFSIDFFDELNKKNTKGETLADNIITDYIEKDMLKKLVYSLLNTGSVLALEKGEMKMEEMIRQFDTAKKMNILMAVFNSEEEIMKKVEEIGYFGIAGNLAERVKADVYEKIQKRTLDRIKL